MDRSSLDRIRMPWPRLKCCDSHDYCNADLHVNVSTWIHDGDGRDPVKTTPDHAGKQRASAESLSQSNDPRAIDRPSKRSTASYSPRPDGTGFAWEFQRNVERGRTFRPETGEILTKLGVCD